MGQKGFCAENNIRTQIVDEATYYCAGDIARVLLLSNVRESARNHPRTEVRQLPCPTRGGIQTMNFISLDGVRRLICQSRSAKAKEVGIHFGVDITCNHFVSVEVESISAIQRALNGVSMIPQFSCGKYRIDLYFPLYKIAVECDEEKVHRPSSLIADKIRERSLITTLGCTFIRFRPQSQGFQILDVINKIFQEILSTTTSNACPASPADEPAFIPRQTDPCIQKYDSDLNLVAVYDTLRDAARQNDNALNFEISRAITNNTLYLDHRWAHVERERKDDIQHLSPTTECKRRIRDKVAKLRDGIIVELYPDARTACRAMDVGKDAVTFAINKKDGVFRDMVFKYWSQCTEEERASYSGNAEAVTLVTSARQVNQIDPDTGAVVKIWNNMQELVQAFKTCHKTLNKKTLDGSVYKGFRWQVAE